MPLLLDVPYEEKEIVKFLGAKWNNNLKKWYISAKQDYPTFRKWILKSNVESVKTIICDYIYILEGKRKCYKCKKETKVITFAADQLLTFWNTQGDTQDFGMGIERELFLLPHFNPMPEKLLEFMQERYNYKNTYSNTRKESYLANRCQYCDALQGDYFLFEESNAPFDLCYTDGIEALNVYRIPLVYDLSVECEEMIPCEGTYVREAQVINESFNL